MRGLFQSFTTFVDDSGFSTLQVVKFFCFFLTFAHRRTVGKAGTFSCENLALMWMALNDNSLREIGHCLTARLFNILWSDPIEDGVNADPTTFGSIPQSHSTIMQNQFAGDP